MREHHIGIIVKNIQSARDTYNKLGYTAITDIIYDDVQHNNIMLLENSLSMMKIELIQAADAMSTVYSTAKGYHHVCYEATSVEEIKSIFEKRGTGIVFTKMIKAKAFDNRMICFAMLHNGTIVEFLCK